jgi:endonuclease YncB( thermonuclease family)
MRPRFTIGCRTLPQEAVPVVPQAKDFILQTHGLDKYKRTLADVLLPDGTNVNHTLIKNGWCWWYRKYAPRNRELERLEKHAREAKTGLWVAPTQVPPWEWAKQHK